MVAADVLNDDEVIYEVGADPIAQNTVRPESVPNNQVLGHYISSAEEMARHSMERKIQAGHIINHHGAMQMYLANARLANVMGLNEDQKSNITPFPSPNRVTIVNGGSDAKLVGVVESLVGKLIDKVQTPAASTEPQPAQPTQPDTLQPVQPVTNATNWWCTMKKYGSTLAWILAAGSSITAAALALRPSPTVPSTPTPTQVLPAPSDIEGTIGVTIE